MWLSLLKKYWFEIITILFVMYSTTTIYILKQENQALISKVSETKAQLQLQNTIIEQNRADYKEAMNRLPIVLTKIETKYKTQYEKIYAWRDRNETDCNNNLAFINGFEF